MQETTVQIFSTTSDRRLKKNIVDNNVGLEKINQIQVRNFEYRTRDEIDELPKDSVIPSEGAPCVISYYDVFRSSSHC